MGVLAAVAAVAAATGSVYFIFATAATLSSTVRQRRLNMISSVIDTMPAFLLVWIVSSENTSTVCRCPIVRKEKAGILALRLLACYCID